MDHLQAADVMTIPVITVAPETPIVEAARLLVQHRISGMPVIEPDGSLVGMVTEADLLPKQLEPDDLAHWLLQPRRSNEERRRFEGRICSDIMTPSVITAGEDTSLADLARIMLRRRVNRIPIVRGGALVGIVTRNDLLKVFERTDAELADAVTRYIVDDLWIDPARVRVTAKGGLVTIDGEMERQVEAELIAACRVDGAVAIDTSGLTYRYDNEGRQVHP